MNIREVYVKSMVEKEFGIDKDMNIRSVVLYECMN